MQISVRIPEDLHRPMQQTMMVRGLTRTQLVLNALRSYMDVEASDDLEDIKRRLSRLEEMANL